MRLKDKFKQLKKENRGAFIAYVPFGFPNPSATKNICLSLERGGADVIELGIPFSDPLADGPIIQAATTKALANGANIDKFFSCLGSLDKVLTIPVAVMTYYNPIFKFGISQFFKQLKKYKVSAVLVVDLPLEESDEYLKQARKYDIDTIFFITPTTDKERIKRIVRSTKGFIYYISITGITGPKDIAYGAITKQIKGIKKLSNLPVCVGFGIHSAKQVAEVNKFSDGAIVGSSIVKFIEGNYDKKDFLRRLERYTASLCMK
ncbi:MAG: tryptophan synthase subunit alpha [Candidatus Omnitrophica bacterium]|nr:tryptophan synthase subunit alpha [Candidatus Omnitrophota bacterium]